ncbi:MAG: hypothetical protein KKA05_05385 [Alphaproteobacteria bacterium]|nr:hypothetical protein [Alphaproteobacteria bacterium]MBU0859282.1 hypothetical protein [Alphaproteobacteria bacterium]
MKHVLAFATALLLAGCGTSVTTYHTNCMDAYPDFANQLACVKNNIAADPYQSNDTLVREYLLTGDMLAADVRAGKISDESARLQFLQKLNDIKRIELEQMANESRIRRDMDMRFPRQTTCHPVGGSVQCTTY